MEREEGKSWSLYHEINELEEEEDDDDNLVVLVVLVVELLGHESVLRWNVG